LHNWNVGVIGDTLSEARTRRRVDLEEVQAATGIRPRYLEAIEQEDWDALPEEFYARSFIRKYAVFLGVDPEPLVDEYKRQQRGEARGGAPTSPFARTRSRKAEALRRRRKRQSVYAWLGAVVLLAAIVVAIVLVSQSGGEGGGKKTDTGTGVPTPKKGIAPKAKTGAPTEGKKKQAKGAHAQGVKLAIVPTAEVWTCVVDGKGRRLVDGKTLAPGKKVGPFHARSYTAAFGNGSVHVLVDGKLAKTPATSDPMGIEVDSHGKVRELQEGSRPTCE
jgi:cytoskeleton protein RodZ